LIGSGKFGVVHKVNLGGFICAQKTIKTSLMTEDQKAYLKREHAIVRQLKHKNIVSMLGLTVRYAFSIPNSTNFGD